MSLRVVERNAARRTRVLVTTVPFAEQDRGPRELLDQAEVTYEINPLGRRLREDELTQLARDVDVLIAGTEPITERVMQAAPRLRLIARVGVGLDNVDLAAARRRGIQVAYTPDAPSPAVAEMTVGLMLALLRHIPHADRDLRRGEWQRRMGRRLAELTVGIVGVGRIGQRVIHHLRGGFPETRLLANDLVPDRPFGAQQRLEWVDKETLFCSADVVSLHVPLTPLTRGLVGRRVLAGMKSGAVLVNTARGEVVDENDLATALREERLGGAAIDVFEREPYTGPLVGLERCLLTCHMGSMSEDCRHRMELEATEEALRFLRDEPLRNPAPDAEYELQGAVA